MPLPGKLCIGILEEDNPLRSYFRFKPLLLENGGTYAPFEGEGKYPDEGCIRIVPDKNESYHFKARMRQMGLFCVVDLRDHPNENDKIRPNKNYKPEGEEINACIIYSDVVRAPAPGMIFEVMPASAAQGPVRMPRTSMVLLEDGDAVNPVCHTWEAAGTEGKVTLRATPAVCPVEGLQVFELPDFKDEKMRFAIRPAGSMDAVCDMPEKPEKPEKVEKPEKAEKTEKIEKIDKVEKPAEPEKPAAVKAAPEKPAAEADAPEKPVEKMPEEKPEAESPARVEEEMPKAAEPAPEKPWIHRDASMAPRPVDRRLSRSEQLRAAQAGLNPRRGRSLQELIDEKWQHSRLDQLGMTAGPIATGAPVRNPVDAAVEAFKAAWEQPDMRQPLMDALRDMDDFQDSMRKYREQAGVDHVEAQLNSLEAQRLELLNELDKLKTGNRNLREQLKQEVRQEEDAALSDAVEKTKTAQAQLAKYEQMATDARAAAKDARGMLDNLVGEQLEQKIRDVALIRRVEERLKLLRGAVEGETIPAEPLKIDINAFIDRLVRRFAAEGWSMSRTDAANLGVCLALCPSLILSGAPGSGKTAAARILADALGLGGAGRVAICPPEPKSALRDQGVEALRRFPESPAMVILDDANLCPGPDVLRGMGQVFDPEWRTVTTVQDAHSGASMSAAALDRGFMVRMSAPEKLPWMPAQKRPAPVFTLTSIQAIQASLPAAEVPSAIVERMDALRGTMAKRGARISRRALDDTWRYCAAMLAILGSDITPERVFDLAVAQRVMPSLLASAPVGALMAFREMAEKLPTCQRYLRLPLPIAIG